MTKPTDYKAEAQAFLDRYWHGKITLDAETLAALLERLCGEAKKARDCHWWEQLCLADAVACDPLEVKRWVLQMHELAREEGRREQKEKDAQLAGLNCWPLDGRQTQDDIVRRIREAKP